MGFSLFCYKQCVNKRKKDDISLPVGVMAHIEGENPDFARHNPDLDYPEKNAYDNLIFLCPTCHDKVDSDFQIFSVKKLYEIKFDSLY